MIAPPSKPDSVIVLGLPPSEGKAYSLFSGHRNHNVAEVMIVTIEKPIIYSAILYHYANLFAGIYI
jgi:hypothetical protein